MVARRGTGTDSAAGYLAACLGTLAGGAAGVSLGRFVALPLAHEISGDVKGSGDAEGVDAVIEGFGVGLGAVILGVMVFVLAIIVTTWLGAVLGCALAVRLSGNDGAGPTALLTGLAGPVIFLVGAQIVQASVGTLGGAGRYLFLGVVAVAAALTGRCLALRLRRSPRRGGEPRVVGGSPAVRR